MKLPKVLDALLRVQRPHGGTGEMIARQVVMLCVQEQPKATMKIDGFGNVIAHIPDKGGRDSGVWFTSHLDTVHRREGKLEPVLIADGNILMADDEFGTPSVLGADDAAGVYLMTEMLKAGKPGTYAFFLGEECGGLGSSDYIKHHPKLSANICVSFDRRGTSNVITHQAGYRTASDEFAMALSAALNKQGMKYLPYDGGIYTDSKEFAELVPECTNISVGYEDEHTTQESLDLTHLYKLRDAVLAIDWASLPVHRVPVPDEWLSSRNSGLNSWRDTPSELADTMADRIDAVINKHYAALPYDVLEILEELSEILR